MIIPSLLRYVVLFSVLYAVFAGILPLTVAGVWKGMWTSLYKTKYVYIAVCIKMELAWKSCCSCNGPTWSLWRHMQTSRERHVIRCD